MSAAFHVRADDDQRPGDRISVLMVVEFRFLTRCVIVGNLDAVIDDLFESAIMEMMNENQKRFAGIYAKVSAIVYHRPICHITILCVTVSRSRSLKSGQVACVSGSKQQNRSNRWKWMLRRKTRR